MVGAEVRMEARGAGELGTAIGQPAADGDDAEALPVGLLCDYPVVAHGEEPRLVVLHEICLVRAIEQLGELDGLPRGGDDERALHLQLGREDVYAIGGYSEPFAKLRAELLRGRRYPLLRGEIEVACVAGPLQRLRILEDGAKAPAALDGHRDAPSDPADARVLIVHRLHPGIGHVRLMPMLPCGTPTKGGAAANGNSASMGKAAACRKRQGA